MRRKKKENNIRLSDELKEKHSKRSEYTFCSRLFFSFLLCFEGEWKKKASENDPFSTLCRIPRIYVYRIRGWKSFVNE